MFYEPQANQFASADLGVVNHRDLSKHTGELRGTAATKTLQEVNFLVGDYIDVAFLSFVPNDAAVSNVALPAAFGGSQVRLGRSSAPGGAFSSAPRNNGGGFGTSNGFVSRDSGSSSWARGGGEREDRMEPQADSSWPGEKDGNKKADAMDEDKPPSFANTERGRLLAQQPPEKVFVDDGPWGGKRSGGGEVAEVPQGEPSQWD